MHSVAAEVEGERTCVCDVTEGGIVSNNKGLSLPGVAVSVPAMSEKDAGDLEFALRLGVDFIALSFVRAPEDVKLVHRIMDEVGIRRPVIAKIEKPEAVERLDEIVLAFDGIMVARGDLGVEMPLERVPVVQKSAIQIARDNAKPVIVATQMLESMITHSRPTRAEASDVANAVIDGTDAVMLSGETSVGKFPVQAVATMDRIITSVETSGTGVSGLKHVPRTPSGAIAKAAKDIGDALGAVALVAFTQTGDTARRLSRLQPAQRLLVFTPVEHVQRQMALLWGAEAHLVWEVKTTDEMVRQVDSALLQRGACRPGDLVIVVAGTPPSTPGATNTIRVHHIGDILRHDHWTLHRPSGRQLPPPPPRMATSQPSSAARGPWRRVDRIWSRLLDLEQIEEDIFRGVSPKSRLQRVFGGQVAGQALVAAGRTVPDDRPVHSLHSYFIRPGDPSIPIVYEVERIRDGRSFTTRRATAIQHGKPIFMLRASFQMEQAGLDHQADECPATSRRRRTYRRCRSATPTRPEAVAETFKLGPRPIDLRYVDDPPWGPSAAKGPRDGYTRVWMRATGALPDDPLLHVCVLTFCSDMTLLDSILVKHGLAPGIDPISMASLDHAMWFMRPFRADDWMLYVCKSPAARGEPRPGHRTVLHPRRRAPGQRRAGRHDPRRRLTPVWILLRLHG